MRKLGFAGALALGLSLVSLEAAADITKAQCVDANTYGQTLRREGKLTAAKGQFQTCNDPKCPEIVRTDCTQRMEEVETAFPSIVFDVKDSAGADLSAVKVMVDGQQVADKIDGLPLRVDPGSHEFKFEVAGEKALIRTFVLKEGEKLRRERILFVGENKPVTPPPATPAVPAKTKAEPSKSGGIMRAGGLALAAGGLVAIGVGSFYGVKALGKKSDQEENCKSATSCRNYPQATSDHDGAEVWGRFSTIGFIAGGVLLVGGAVLFFTAPKSEATGVLKKVLPIAQAASTGWAF